MATGRSEEAIGQAGAGLEPGRTAQSQRETPPLKIPLADWFRVGSSAPAVVTREERDAVSAAPWTRHHLAVCLTCAYSGRARPPHARLTPGW